MSRWRPLLVLALLGAMPLWAQIEEEDLPLGSTWSVRLEEAQEVFHSAQQPDAIPLLSALLEELEQWWTSGRLDAEGRDVFIRSLALRAEAAFNLGDSPRAETDLDRLVVLDPSFTVDRNLVSPKFWTLFERVRGRHVGELELLLDPPDAMVALDGRPLPRYAASVAVLAGTYHLSVVRPGYESSEREITVPAGRRLSQQISLIRTGAVVSVVSRPVGVRVSVDGVESGRTGGQAPPDLLPTGEAARYPRSEFSDRFLVGDLRPGVRRVELSREGYRSRTLEVVVDEIRDYDLGVVILDRSRGLIRLRGLPSGAAVRVDGAAAMPDRRLPGAPTLTVAPGERRVVVEHRSEGVFEERVRVGDGQTVELQVQLRPALALLGVLGGDPRVAAELPMLLSEALGGESGWMVLDARDRIDELPGFTARGLQRIHPLSFPDGAAGDWRSLQEAAAREVPAAVLALAVLEAGSREADLWLIPAAPSPPLPQVVRGSPERLRRLGRQLAETSGPQASFGALLADVEGPRILALTPGGPAAAAGARPGDRIVGVEGQAVATVEDARRALAAAESSSVQLEGPSGRRTVSLRPQRSWTLPAPNQGRLLRAQLLREPPREAPAWYGPWRRALALLDAGRWEEASPELAAVRPQTGQSPGAEALDYQRALALLAAATGGRREAIRLLQGVSQSTARLAHPDGLPIAPLARLRLDALQGE